jgi:ABC-type Fe2+-enterobactin transport system substrate-binding protein
VASPATNPNAERRSLLKGFVTGWAEVAVRELNARGERSVKAVNVHEYMLERAAECPLALLALQ